MVGSPPRITVIVATFNAAQTLQRCLDSIAGQTYPNTELIVMDGASTDGTVEIIEANSDKVSYWESELDRGVYHAWNKALDHASGEWICFLGADDYFWQSDVLERLEPHLEKASAQRVRVVYGRVAVMTSKGKLLETAGKPWESVRKRFRQEMTIPHVGALHYRSLFEVHGRFDESFRIAGDYDLLLRELKSHAARFVSDVIVAGMQLGGLSSMPEFQLSDIREVAHARRKNGISGLSPRLWRRVIRAWIRLLVSKLVGSETTNRLVDLYRLGTGKPRKWTA